MLKKSEGSYVSKNINLIHDERLTLGHRMSDSLAKFAGSWTFILSFAAMLVVWIMVNSLLVIIKHFDPYPFILLNLVLSCLAAIQAPIILMSQNREEARDRIRAEHDFEINLKAEKEIEHIQEELDLIRAAQDLDIIKSLEEIKSLLVQVSQHKRTD